MTEWHYVENQFAIEQRPKLIDAERRLEPDHRDARFANLIAVRYAGKKLRFSGNETFGNVFRHILNAHSEVALEILEHYYFEVPTGSPCRM